MALPLIPVMGDEIDAQILEATENQLKIFKGIESLLTNGDKKRLEILQETYDASEEYYKREQQIQQLVIDDPHRSSASIKALHARNKASLHWNKFVIKNKWLQKIGKGIANIAKGVANLAGNWFFKIIGFLLAMAIFDPKGTMLRSILKFLIGIVVWFVKILASMLPDLIRTIIDLITNVFPDIIRDIISSVFPVLSKVFKKLAKDLEADFPVISWFVDLLGSAFAKDGILYKFGMALASMLPLLLGGFLLLGAIMKMMPFLKGMFAILKGGTFILQKLGMAIWWLFGAMFPLAKAALVKAAMAALVAIKGWAMSALAFLGPVLLIVAAVVAAGILIWKFKDQIVGFFEGLWDKFKKMGTAMKILVVVIALVLLPLTLIIAGIYGLAKLFQYIKKKGIKQAAKDIWKQITKFGKMIWKAMSWPYVKFWGFLKKGASFVWNMFKKIGKVIWKAVSNIFGGIASAVFTPFKTIFKVIKKLATSLAPVLGPIGDVLKTIADVLKNTILKTINYVVNAFNKIQDYFSAIMTYGSDFFTTGTEGRNLMVNSATYAREAGSSIAEVARFRSGGGGSVATRRASDVLGTSITRDTLGKGLNISGGEERYRSEAGRIASATRLKVLERQNRRGSASGSSGS